MDGLLMSIKVSLWTRLGESYYPTVRLPIFDSVSVGYYAGVIGLCVKSDNSNCSLAWLFPFSFGTAFGSGIGYIGWFPAIWNMWISFLWLWSFKFSAGADYIRKTFGRWNSYAPLPVGWIISLGETKENLRGINLMQKISNVEQSYRFFDFEL